MSLKSLQLLSTQELLTLWRGGNPNAREALLARHLPALRRLAHNRLPAQARDLAATEDLVQSTVIKVLHHLDAFRSDEPGALLAYLRAALMNTLRDEVRRCKRLPNRIDAERLDENASDTPTPIQNVLTEQALAAYEHARSRLKARDQQLISLRIEFGMSYEEIADLTGMKTANAVRMRVSRALLQLAELIDAEAIRP
jgi:RNA polymerase sigma-70 factor (ECF subfamily)